MYVHGEVYGSGCARERMLTPGNDLLLKLNVRIISYILSEHRIVNARKSMKNPRIYVFYMLRCLLPILIQQLSALS